LSTIFHLLGDDAEDGQTWASRVGSYVSTAAIDLFDNPQATDFFGDAAHSTPRLCADFTKMFEPSQNYITFSNVVGSCLVPPVGQIRTYEMIWKLYSDGGNWCAFEINYGNTPGSFEHLRIQFDSGGLFLLRFQDSGPPLQVQTNSAPYTDGEWHYTTFRIDLRNTNEIRWALHDNGTVVTTGSSNYGAGALASYLPDQAGKKWSMFFDNGQDLAGAVLEMMIHDAELSDATILARAEKFLFMKQVLNF
jgi:hypothetical protein